MSRPQESPRRGHNRQCACPLGWAPDHGGTQEAKHSFTVPGADEDGMEGLKYDRDAARKSWARMIEFLKKTLKT